MKYLHLCDPPPPYNPVGGPRDIAQVCSVQSVISGPGMDYTDPAVVYLRLGTVSWFVE